MVSPLRGGRLLLSHSHIRTHHTLTETLIPLPSHFPPPNDFKHFMKMLFSLKLLPFCLALLRSLGSQCAGVVMALQKGEGAGGAELCWGRTPNLPVLLVGLI